MPNMVSKVSLGYILSLSDLWYCICFGNVRDTEVYMYSLLHGTQCHPLAANTITHVPTASHITRKRREEGIWTVNSKSGVRKSKACSSLHFSTLINLLDRHSWVECPDS
jgi:hypothetical protein